MVEASAKMGIESICLLSVVRNYMTFYNKIRNVVEKFDRVLINFQVQYKVQSTDI